jgi:hypothetical protein
MAGIGLDSGMVVTYCAGFLLALIGLAAWAVFSADESDEACCWVPYWFKSHPFAMMLYPLIALWPAILWPLCLMIVLLWLLTVFTWTVGFWLYETAKQNLSDRPWIIEYLGFNDKNPIKPVDSEQGTDLEAGQTPAQDEPNKKPVPNITSVGTNSSTMSESSTTPGNA